MNLILFLSMLHKGRGKDLEYFQQNYLPSKISTTKTHFNRQACSPGIPPLLPPPTLPTHGITHIDQGLNRCIFFIREGHREQWEREGREDRKKEGVEMFGNLFS